MDRPIRITHFYSGPGVLLEKIEEIITIQKPAMLSTTIQIDAWINA
jgi:hypothetical protein